MSEVRWLSGKPTGPDNRRLRSRQKSAVFSVAQLDILASDRDEVDSTRVDTFEGVCQCHACAEYFSLSCARDMLTLERFPGSQPVARGED